MYSFMNAGSGSRTVSTVCVVRKPSWTLKNGVLDAMSIGYGVLPGGSRMQADYRELSAVKLMEISAVTWGMNPLARVETVKSAAECSDIRELEHLMRDSLQLSKRKAAVAASHLLPILNGRDDQDGDREDRSGKSLSAIADQLQHLNEILVKGQ